MSVKKNPVQNINFSQARLFFWVPVALGVVSAICLIGIIEWELNKMVVGIFMLCISVIVGWILGRRHMHTVDNLLARQERSKSNDSCFYGKIYPVWSRQISTSCQIGDKAVAELTILFGEIVSRLGTMLKIVRDNSHGECGQSSSFIGVIESSQSDFLSAFNDLKAALESVNDSKDMVLAEVTMYSANMRDIAADAQMMAMQSKIIALNAEIEAARAGKEGRAFAAVVSEMRSLADQSAETSAKMAKKVESIDDAMTRFYKDDQKMSEVEARHVSNAETLFDDIVGRFSNVAVDLENSIDTMESESRQVRDDISSALVALQFQDRLSQILTHVADNIDALNKFSEVGIHNLDAETWLDEMKGKFSVEEEYGNLSSNQTSSTGPSLLTIF